MLALRKYSRSAVLSPFITDHLVGSGGYPADYAQLDRLFPELAVIWIIRHGELDIELRPGLWRAAPQAMFIGPLNRAMRIRARGPFELVGLGLRPAGWRALFDRPADEFADRMLTLTEIWGQGGSNLRDIAMSGDDNREIMRAVESEIVRQLNWIGSWQADEAMLGFERISRADSTRQVKDIAAELGLSPKRLERLSRLTFGLTPKRVLRHSRFLDMATVLRDISMPSENQSPELRYFDQSHRNREFRQFIGMTPQQFAQTPTPLFDLALQARQVRKADDSLASLAI